MDRVFVIAEAGVNHNGDRDLAFRLIDAAAAAGADAVKFQTFRAESVVAAGAPKADYQKASTDAGESHLAMLKRLELPRPWHGPLAKHCRESGLAFLSTPYDEDSLAFLVGDVGVETLKIASGEITNGPLLLAAARTGLPLILSTGMSTLDEITDALGVIAFAHAGDGAPGRRAFAEAFAAPAGRAALAEKVSLLHCTTEYPAAADEINLAAMDTLRETFGLVVGFSDHSQGIAIPIAAAARGAAIIEKHFTMNRTDQGPDHAASLEPGELRSMIAGIRAVEVAIGDGIKSPRPSEAGNRRVARRSLVTLAPVRENEPFTEDSLGAKRPGTGISPMEYWDWLGRTATRDLAADQEIDPGAGS